MRTKTGILPLAVLLTVATSLAAAPAEVDGAPAAAVTLTGTLLEVAPAIAFDQAVLRVTGPGGYEAIGWSSGGSVALDLLADGHLAGGDGAPGGPPATLPSGRYGWHLVLHLGDGSRRIHDGTFVTDRGHPRLERRPRLEGPTEDDGADDPRQVSAAAGSANDGFVIDDAIGDGTTIFSMRSDGGFQWEMWNWLGDLRFAPGASSNPSMTVKGDDRVGIGTPQPQADLHLFTPGGTIRITDSDACPNPNAAWEIEEDFGRMKLEVVSNCPGDHVGGKLWIHGNGGLGIGTPDPAEMLHIHGLDPGIRLSNAIGCSQWAGSWQIDQLPGILRIGVAPACPGDPAGTKLSIDGSGNVGIGSHTPLARLHVAGSGIIEGDVSLGSSRTIKHGIEPLDGGEVLTALRSLPLYEWKYRDDPHQASHVGPMAEDVFAAFELGRDDKHLSPADSAGLALAAIQGLDREVAAARARSDGLAEENRRLRDRLVALEERLEALVPDPQTPLP